RRRSAGPGGAARDAVVAGGDGQRAANQGNLRPLRLLVRPRETARAPSGTVWRRELQAHGRPQLSELAHGRAERSSDAAAAAALADAFQLAALHNSIEKPDDVGFHTSQTYPFYELSDPQRLEGYKLAVGLLFEYTLR